MNFAEKFISASVVEKSATAFLDHGPLEHLFSGPDVKLYQFVRNHALKHGVMPSEATYESHLNTVLVPVDEPASYYLAIMRSIFAEKRIHRMQGDINKLMQASSDETRGTEAAKIVSEASSDLTATESLQNGISTGSLKESFVRAYKKKHYAENELFVRMGWPTLDETMGGLDRGDILSICARPGQGKTMLMLYAASFGWAQFGASSPDHSRLFVSMEMDPRLLLNRLAGLLTGLQASKIKHAKLTSADFNKAKDLLAAADTWPSHMNILDGNLAASVADIRAKALKMKPTAIFIDGAYLLSNDRERDRYRRVADNTDLIKKQLAPIAPVICSWQLGRDASKLKHGETPGLEHIAHADAIGQISSVVLGIFEDPPLNQQGKLNPVEKAAAEEAAKSAAKFKRIHILKGRSGEQGEFMVNWDWDKSNFTEYVPEPVEALKAS